MKINKNKTQVDDEIKNDPINLDEAMERLGFLAGTDRPTVIMRWMGLGSSTYTNWRRNKSVPYEKIVQVLLEKGISLDAFFAPGELLSAPVPLVLKDKASHYPEEQKTSIVRATLESKALLASIGYQENEVVIQFLTDLWLIDKGRLFEQPQFKHAIANHLELLEQIGLPKLPRQD